jgi:hypothetical protein
METISGDMEVANNEEVAAEVNLKWKPCRCHLILLAV